LEEALNASLGEIRSRLEKASAIAKVAESCTLCGDLSTAIEAGSISSSHSMKLALLNAASLMQRIKKT